MRLKQLLLPPPPMHTPWSGAPKEPEQHLIARDGADAVSIELPLFWYDPPWSQVPTEGADILATAVAEKGVLVSAMRSDLSDPTSEPRFHMAESMVTSDDDDADDEDDSDAPTYRFLPRLMPYRPERYGFDVRDFDGARVIDLRLVMDRDATGRFAYSPSQIERWEATPTGEPLAGGGWVPAATFPPDVVAMDHLSSKIAQLRVLSPTAAVFVSVAPYRLEAELPSVLAAGPDGVILRLDQLDLDDLVLAALTRRARQMIDASANPSLPLWVVPGEISPDDAVKLTALGANAIAIDAWCDPLVQETSDLRQTVASRLGISQQFSYSGKVEETIYSIVESRIGSQIDRFRGLSQSILRLPPKQRLGSFSATWVKTLDVMPLR